MFKRVLLLTLAIGCCIAPALGYNLLRGNVQNNGIIIKDDQQELNLETGEYIPDSRFEQPSCEYRVQLQRQRQVPAALGIKWDFLSGRVLQIDPASDVYGIVRPGDYFVSEDGMNPRMAKIKRLNLGAAGTVARLAFQTRQGIIYLNCRRQPIESFQGLFQAGL